MRDIGYLISTFIIRNTAFSRLLYTFKKLKNPMVWFRLIKILKLDRTLSITGSV